MLDDAPRQLGAVVDHELRRGLGDRKQVGGELVRRDTVPREHLHAALDERRTDGVLRRERVRARGDDRRAGIAQREREARGLRLEMHDDGDPPPGHGELGREPAKNGHVLPGPVDAPVAFGSERTVGDLGHRLRLHWRRSGRGSSVGRAHG